MISVLKITDGGLGALSYMSKSAASRTQLPASPVRLSNILVDCDYPPLMLALSPRPDSPESQYSQDPFDDGNEHYPNEKSDFNHYGFDAPVHGAVASDIEPFVAGPSSLAPRPSIPPDYVPSEALAHLLDPPPAAFTRGLPRGLAYPPFPPTSVYAHCDRLEKGFPTLAPASTVQPHPFLTHDVSEGDWQLFLDQLQAAAHTHPVNALVAAVVPMAKNLRMPLGKYSPVTLIVKQGVKAHVKNRRNGPVGELIDTWNEYFFYPRCMDVTLAQGKYVFSGTGEGLPPDMVVPTRAMANEKTWRLVLSARHWPAGRTR